MRAIFIIAGHSKYNPGANSLERTINKSITGELAQKLKNSGLDIFTLGMGELSINDKIKIVNDLCKKNGYTYKDSLLIEIHCNSTKISNTGTGTEVLIWDGYEEAKKIAQILLKNTTKLNGLKNRGVKNGLWAKIIRETIPTSIIFETAFINTTKDYEVLTNDLNSFSEGLYNGLKEYIGFKEYNELEELKKENAELKKENEMFKITISKINNILLNIV